MTQPSSITCCSTFTVLSMLPISLSALFCAVHILSDSCQATLNNQKNNPKPSLVVNHMPVATVPPKYTKMWLGGINDNRTHNAIYLVRNPEYQLAKQPGTSLSKYNPVENRMLWFDKRRSNALRLPQPWLRVPGPKYRMSYYKASRRLANNFSQSRKAEERTGARRPDENGICEKVCHVCRQVLSIRWAALCFKECRLGGRAYDACLTVWFFRHSIFVQPTGFKKMK